MALTDVMQQTRQVAACQLTETYLAASSKAVVSYFCSLGSSTHAAWRKWCSYTWINS